MDILPSVDLLRDHLIAHDKAVREIIMLDQYIEHLSQQTFLASMGERMTPAYKQMIRISVAEGMKRMYKEYRLAKWLKITEMAATVRRVLDAEMGQPEFNSSHNGQQQLVPANNMSPWQQQNQYNYQTTRPMNMFQPMLSPIPGPIHPIISPIHTPSQMATEIISRHITGATPDEFHQYAIANISANENSVTSRQLFQDENSDMYTQFGYEAECEHSVADDIIVIESDNEEHETDVVSNSALSVNVSNVNQISSSSVPTNIVNGNEINQSVYLSNVQNYPNNFNELPDDHDEMMEWEEDSDDEYNDSEESLAGVLFATERLLPDEQAVRLDVEMGDMGVGHIVFDRVSATWYIQHCEYYRAN
ncbi:hypothetical protein ACF0H5_003698 [Mactra antiquata]